MSKAKRLANKKANKTNEAENTGGEIQKDKSPYVFQDKKMDWELNIRNRHELTEKQKVILETMMDKKTNCVMIDGVYGSSKTFCSVLAGLKLLNEKKITKITYIRNPVESSTTGKLGYLKGESSDKMAPYAAALHQKLAEFLPSAEVERLIKEERVEVVPLGFTRGLSWNCQVIIVDEAACLTYDDIFLLLTRCGPFTKIFFIGDSQNQSDIGNKSGFERIFKIFNDEESMKNGVFCFELKELEDVVRSGFVRFVMLKTGLIKPRKQDMAIDEPMFVGKP
jgi:predicted ribonuclease YlaK